MTFDSLSEDQLSLDVLYYLSCVYRYTNTVNLSVFKRMLQLSFSRINIHQTQTPSTQLFYISYTTIRFEVSYAIFRPYYIVLNLHSGYFFL